MALIFEAGKILDRGSLGKKRGVTLVGEDQGVADPAGKAIRASSLQNELHSSRPSLAYAETTLSGCGRAPGGMLHRFEVLGLTIEPAEANTGVFPQALLHETLPTRSNRWDMAGRSLGKGTGCIVRLRIAVAWKDRPEGRRKLVA